MQKKYYIAGLFVLLIAIGGFFYFKKTPTAMEKFAAEKSDPAVSSAPVEVPIAGSPSKTAYYCPKAESITKKDQKWVTADGKWQNYTPSSANKISGFIGAQWVGVKVGKVICLYTTDEAVSFPVALEQTRNQLILEPQGAGWSALVENRKYCKSASIADCPYYVERPADINNVYEQIQYNPSGNN